MPQSYTRTVRDIFRIAFVSVASLGNLIIFIVLGALFYFGETKPAIFLSLAVFFNVFAGLINDIRARIALEKLQLLTTPKFVRVNADGSEESVFPEVLAVGDTLRLRLGDQVPCDATLLSASNFEISQALMTGESDSFPKKKGEVVLAGSVVVAGVASARVDTLFEESRLAQMTSGIKRYSISLSPIQNSVNDVIRYSGYVVLLIIGFIAARGMYLQEDPTSMVKAAASLTGMLIPQGLMVATTLLFAYGAIRLLREHVLLQDVNATEKLGRIRNLCIDKTGTLTENTPTVETLHVAPGIAREEAAALTTSYISGSGDSSQTVQAIQAYLGATSTFSVIDSTPFTSQKRYGAVLLEQEESTSLVVMAGPDILLPYIGAAERTWLKKFLDDKALRGKRLVCVARAQANSLPASLEGVELSPVAVFVLENALRPGTRDIVSFLQGRGIRIRVISGDNPDTVQAVAASAGIHDTELVVSGSELAEWSEAQWQEKAGTYTIYARITPEQKERLVEAIKKSGFTAMVGDGANDALAIKKADLGIAMFDGAAATRQLSSVVLTNNSFSALPGGVRMADNFIGNIEIISGLYFFEMILGLLLFIAAAAIGYGYPISPQNMVFINYFTLGFPAILTFYWAMRPLATHRPASLKPFLRRVLPFPTWSAALALVPLLGIFLYNLPELHTSQSSSPVVITFVVLSFIFLCFAPKVYNGVISRMQRGSLAVLGVGELVLLVLAFTVPLASVFFDLTLR